VTDWLLSALLYVVASYPPTWLFLRLVGRLEARRDGSQAVTGSFFITAPLFLPAALLMTLCMVPLWLCGMRLVPLGDWVTGLYRQRDAGRGED